jgi:uncharacterized protein (TIGR03067 family)
MVRRIVFALALGLLCVPAARLVAAWDKNEEKAEASMDQERFQGTWTFVSLEQGGKQALQNGVTQTITFQGDKFTVKAGDTVVQAGTQKLNAGKNPRTADASVTEGEGKGTTMLGIYRLEGDVFVACFNPQGKKRPTEFKAPADSGYFLLVAKRAQK